MMPDLGEMTALRLENVFLQCERAELQIEVLRGHAAELRRLLQAQVDDATVPGCRLTRSPQGVWTYTAAPAPAGMA
jgi:hypothetical protein